MTMNVIVRPPIQSELQSEIITPLEARFVAPGEWDRLVTQFRDVLHEQTECFNALRWKPHQLERVAFYRENTLVSAAVVLVMRLPIINTGIAVVKWGPLWRKKQADADANILEETIAELKKIYALERSFFLSFFPRADPEISEIEEEAFRQAGFFQGEQLDSPERYFVNTGIPLDDIRKSLAQKWRYNLKKAEKKDLNARYLNGRAGAQAFMSLYREMMDRKNFHDTSAINTLEELMVAQEPSLRPIVILIDDENGETVASGVVDVAGERAVYLYGATRDQALPLNAGYLMHWELVKRLKAEPDNKWYDLGGADAESRLHQFKRGFVGKSGVIATTPNYYHFAAKWHVRALGQLLYFVRRTKGRFARRLHEMNGGQRN